MIDESRLVPAFLYRWDCREGKSHKTLEEYYAAKLEGWVDHWRDIVEPKREDEPVPVPPIPEPEIKPPVNNVPHRRPGRPRKVEA